MTNLKIYLRQAIGSFARPADFTTPMSRLDFWLFYAGYAAILAPFVLLLQAMLSLVAILPPWLFLPMQGLVLLLILYMISVLFAAMARRMQDSGYRRSSLAGMLFSFIFAFALFTKAAFDAYTPGIPIAQQPVPNYPPILFVSLAAGAALAIHVFYGLIGKTATARPDRDEPANTDPRAF